MLLPSGLIGMRIESVDCYTLEIPIGRTVGDSRLSITDVYWIVVELETDTGITGTGWMGSLGFGPGLMAEFVDSQFADLLLGRHPFELTAIHEDLRRQTIYYGENGMAAWPRGAIDVALWDIKAKSAGVPLYRLLGGDDRRVSVYASLMDATEDDRTAVAERHRDYAQRGFSAFKTKVGDRPATEEAARVAVIREAVGEGASIFVDANQAWTVTEAIEYTRKLDAHDIGWVEEPISEYDLRGHDRVARRIDPPLATGEMFYRPERFTWLFDIGSIGIVQPDLVRLGGISGLSEAAQLAQRHHTPFVPHFYYAVSAHVVSAAPTGRMAEYIPAYDIADALEDPPAIEAGEVVLPDRPGHGYEIADSARTQYGTDPTDL
jgi:L-alanine-DL-glutamate epimerase-like enolase superfamily enzyme